MTIVLRDRLLIALAAARVGIAELASASGVSIELLQRLACGGAGVLGVTALERLSRALHCTPDWLVGLSDASPRFGDIRRAFAARRTHAAKPRRPRAASSRNRLLRSEWAPTMPPGAQATAASGVAPAARSRSPRQPTATVARIGTRLGQVLEHTGVTKAELAVAARVPVTLLVDVCGGRRVDVAAHRISSIARVLGCSMSWLMGLSEQAPSAEVVRAALAASRRMASLPPARRFINGD